MTPRGMSGTVLASRSPSRTSSRLFRSYSHSKCTLQCSVAPRGKGWTRHALRSLRGQDGGHLCDRVAHHRTGALTSARTMVPLKANGAS